MARAVILIVFVCATVAIAHPGAHHQHDEPALHEEHAHSATRNDCCEPEPHELTFAHFAFEPQNLQRQPVTGFAENIYAAQLHVHAALETPASFSSQLWEAQNAGVDVVWWSNHDWRLAAYHHAATFGFEDWSVPLHLGENWQPNLELEAGQTKLVELSPHNSASLQVAISAFTDATATEGGKSLQLAAISSGEPSWESYTVQYTTSIRVAHRHAIAGQIAIDIDVLPWQLSPDARAVVRFVLSEHPQNSVLPFTRWYTVKYVLDNSKTTPWRENEVYCVPVPYVSGQWNHYTLNLTADAVAGFPFIYGEDNGINDIHFGLEVRNGDLGAANFDNYRLSQSIKGQALYQRHVDMTTNVYQPMYPSITQHHGTEISWENPHLNEFMPSGTSVLHDYDDLVVMSGLAGPDGVIPAASQDDWENFVASYITNVAQAGGGVVSWNHPNYGNTQQTIDDLISKELFGTDMLEVGIRTRYERVLQDFLNIWDAVLNTGYFVLGNGTNDSHGGTATHWLFRPNNMVTWLYAADTSSENLVDAMKRGRMTFGDIALFDGYVDLIASNGFRMGNVVFTDKESIDVNIVIDGIEIDDEIRIFDTDHYLSPLAATSTSVNTWVTMALDDPEHEYLRVEIYNPDGPVNKQEKAFSNPIHFVRCAPAYPVRAERAALDVKGVKSESFSGFKVTNVCWDSFSLSIDGVAETGEIVLDLTGAANFQDVFFTGFSGSESFSVNGNLLTITGLEGEGSINVGLTYGDADLNNTVNVNDVTYVIYRLGTFEPSEYGIAGDANLDGVVDVNDITFVVFRL